MTHFLTVRDVSRPRAFSADLSGERVVMEENLCIVRLANCWVADIDGSRDWRARRAHVLTAPLDRSAEARCYVRDPDGYLIEVGQATGLVEGRLAEQAPAGREAGRADGR